MTKLQPHRSRFELKAIFALFLAIVVTGAVAVASSAGNTGSPRSGELHVTKNCSHYTGAANRGNQIWNLLMLQLWWERYVR